MIRRQSSKSLPRPIGLLVLLTAASVVSAAESSGALSTNTPAAGALLETSPQPPAEGAQQNWNWHVQNTVIVQGYPGFSAAYFGPNSLPNGGQVRESISHDLFAGARLWSGAEAHVDGLMWQGFGLADTVGIEAFPNGEAFRLGTSVPNVTFAR